MVRKQDLVDRVQLNDDFARITTDVLDGGAEQVLCRSQESGAGLK